MKNRKKKIALIAIALAAAVVIGMLPSRVEAASSSEIKKQINELEDKKDALKAQYDELRSQYEATENEIQELVNQKDLIDQEISLLYEQITVINDQISSYSLLIADKQDELDDAQARLADLREKNKERIQAMEEEGGLSYWSIIFQANSFFDLLDRINMIQEINAADQRRMQEMAEVADEVAQAQEVLTQEKAELEETRAELDEAQATLEEKRAAADELLLELIAKGEEFEVLMDESEELQDELMQEIAAKEKEYDKAKYQEWLATSVATTRATVSSGSTTPSSSAPSSSGWVCPVPYYSLTSGFGMRLHPIQKVYKMHNGVDMSCATGTPIYASRSGQVTVASYQAGGAGNYVSINHGDGFSSVYMHMTHYIVSVGQYVNAGQVIGYVGSTGGSTGPHLHFGISYNGTYVNPMNYL